MKKLYFLTLTVMVGLASFGQNPIITTIVDGDCTGGNPKLLEIYANGTVNFADFSLEKQTNANDTWGSAQDLSSFGVVTNGFVYITTSGSADALAGEFPALSSADILISNTINVNGDDRVRIVLAGTATVIDQYGVDAQSGTGKTWEYKDSYAKRVNDTGPDNGFTESNWTFAGVSSLKGLGTCQGGADTFETLIGGIGTFTTTQNTDPTINITSPANGAALAPGTTSVNVEFTTSNLSGSETINITVNGTTTNDATSPFEVTTTDGQSYDVTVDLVGGGVLDTAMISFSVLSSSTVATLADLRAGTLGEVYELTGEAVISYIVTDNNRNQKYIQDNTAGIFIDDEAGVLSTAFNIGDGITGLQGQLGEHSGVMQFVPVANVAAASSKGNTITPEVITVQDFLADGEAYESELIKIDGIVFNVSGQFEDHTDYEISDGGASGNVTIARVSFGDENLVGAYIPTAKSSVIGLGSQFDADYQILPRYVTDVEGATLSVADFKTATFSVYPNPTAKDFVNIKANNNEQTSVAVFDILRKRVINQTLTNDRLDVSTLNTGIYILKISQNSASATKKLVIK